ncbi:hypothetical protein, partial [Pseudomonas aeruginosa]|uniref:hypothetical protein n=1 Tax=Pseudomonas aeruginosa TaxID=287 RepID=UPI001ABCE7FC
GVHGGGSGIQEGHHDAERAVQADVMALEACPATSIERAAQGCAFFILDAAKSRLGYDDKTSPPSLGNPARHSAMWLSLPTLLCGS